MFLILASLRLLPSPTQDVRERLFLGGTWWECQQIQVLPTPVNLQEELERGTISQQSYRRTGDEEAKSLLSSRFFIYM